RRADLACYGARVVRASDGERVISRWVLRVGKVVSAEGVAGSGEIQLPDGVHNSHDSEAVCARVGLGHILRILGIVHALANGIAIRPEVASQALIDDDHRRGAFIVALLEVAPA